MFTTSIISILKICLKSDTTCVRLQHARLLLTCHPVQVQPPIEISPSHSSSLIEIAYLVFHLFHKLEFEIGILIHSIF